VRLSPEEYRLVLAFFEKAVEAEPNRWSYWCDIGFCLGKLGQWREAAAALERIAEQVEVSAKVLSMLGHAYLRLERYPEAEAVLARAHALAPDNLNVLYKIALVRFHRGEFALALPPLEQVIRHRPRHAKAHYNLGLIYHRLGEGESVTRQLAIIRELDQALADRLAEAIRDGE